MQAGSYQRKTSPLPAWQPLVFRQACLLAGIAGMLCFRYPWHGALAAVLLALFFLPALRRTRAAQGLFLFFLLAGLAFAGATTRAPLAPAAVPAWVRAAVTPDGADSDPRFKNGVSLTGTVAHSERLPGNRIRFLLRAVTAADEEAPLPGLLVLTWQSPPPFLAAAGPGQRLNATLRLREIRGFANPGLWETDRYWRDQGAHFRAWSKGDGSRGGKAAPCTVEGEPSHAWALRETLRSRVVNALAGSDAPPDDAGRDPRLTEPAAIILALLFGDRSLCAPAMLDLVAQSTLAHSLALSGMHLGFVAGLGYGAAHLAGLLFPALFLRLPRQKAGILLALPATGAYLWLGGAPPSLVRAALMLFFWAVLLWRGRPKVLPDGLIWAVAVILIFSPHALYDIRLQLSAVSVGGIALAMPLLRRLVQKILGTVPARRAGPLRRLACAAAGMAGVSAAAQLAVLPLVLDVFPGTGLWLPLNLLWLPALGLWVMPLGFAGLFAAALGFADAASVIFSLAHIPCECLLALLQAMDEAGVLAAPVALRPAWPAMAGYWVLALLIPTALTARAPDRRVLALFCAGFALVIGPSVYASVASRRDMVRLQFIDVGQGQAALVSWQGRTGRGRALVDGGGFSSPNFDVGRHVVAPVLTANAAPDIDWVVNSHPDADHLQGLLFPLDTFRVGAVAFGPGAEGEKNVVTNTILRRDAILRKRALTPRTWRAGDVVTLAPGLVFEVLHPEASGSSRNNNALVLRLVRDGKPLALICGDVEKEGIREIVARNASLAADVLVLPHHGSASSLSPELYDAARPRLALAACGYANAWHFPARAVREALAERGVPLATTAEQGQITIVWEKGKAMRTIFARK